jgi:DNA-binding winged helix-turn-helix (wHTH) protein
VPYETIYEELWGASIVEDNQMHFQKRKLIARIREIAPEHEDLIKTVPKQGFMLDAEPETISVMLRAAKHAAAPAARKPEPALF